MIGRSAMRGRADPRSSDGHASRSARRSTAAIAKREAATVNGGTSTTATLPATIAPPKKNAVAVSIARPVARRARSGERARGVADDGAAVVAGMQGSVAAWGRRGHRPGDPGRPTSSGPLAPHEPRRIGT
jgi:hypothetical protein